MGLYGSNGNDSSGRSAFSLRLGKESIQVQGVQGISAYEVAVENGYTGTEAEWLTSLVGPQGPLGSPLNIWTGTQVAYDALGVWDDETLYFVI